MPRWFPVGSSEKHRCWCLFSFYVFTYVCSLPWCLAMVVTISRQDCLRMKSPCLYQIWWGDLGYVWQGWSTKKAYILEITFDSDILIYNRRYWKTCTVKPVCNDNLHEKNYCLWFIQQCVLMKTAGTNSLLLTISAFWSSSRWTLAT